MTVKNRIAIVTGGAMGNGKGITEVLASQGASVAIFDKSDILQDTVKEFQDMGYDVCGFRTDITDRKNIDESVAAVVEKYGRIDILINNAGVMKNLPFLETGEDNLDFHININIKGPWNVSQSVIPHMIKNNYGRIVTIASVTGGFVDDGGDMSYSLTKSALIGFGRCLAMEFIEYGITSNIICPGYCNTPMVAKEAAEEKPDNPDDFLKDLANSLPIGRLGKPQDIGFLASYLASDEASFITGQTVVIDGGCTLPETNLDY
ncbi:MAG: SDR family oxidoreductase [Clostridia bacterium]|nr:SDR family oxidoreductase [Clostridia bacterium]